MRERAARVSLELRAPTRETHPPGREEKPSLAMISKAAFKHSNRYAATASKYESVIERPVGPPRGPSKSSGKSGGNKPGPWDGVKPDAKSSGKRRERNEEKNSLLEKDYLAEAREKRERTSSIIGNVRAREDVRSPRENRTRDPAQLPDTRR